MRHLGGLGWVRDRPDPRDIKLGVIVPTTPPTVTDLRNEHMPVPYAQLQLSSCVGNAVAGMVSYVHSFEGRGPFDASRLFIYYQARAIEGSQDMDSGAQVRDAMRACATVGVCSEETDPYSPEQVCVAPSPAMLAEASQHCISRYMRVPVYIPQIRNILAQGYPIAFGFTCFESFEGPEIAKSGMLTMPESGEQDIGGHAVVACGHDSTGNIGPGIGYTLCRNSWGTDWGLGGYFWMPDQYLINFASDFWTVRLEA